MPVSEWIQIVILALIQGISEFLPISSSAHLILPSQLLGWKDQGLAFDVGVHLGTLLAVIVYFRKDIWRLALAWLASLTGSRSHEATLGWFLILATMPAVIAGFILVDLIATWGRSILIIACTTLIFGILLGWADLKGKLERSLEDIKLQDALLIGFAQALALIPGTSRSGATITMGLLLGFDRNASARFSFLLSIPVIIGACVLMGVKVAQAETALSWSVMATGAIIAGISAWICIHLFLKWITRAGMLPFVIYRLILGVFLLGLYFYTA